MLCGNAGRGEGRLIVTVRAKGLLRASAIIDCLAGKKVEEIVVQIADIREGFEGDRGLPEKGACAA